MNNFIAYTGMFSTDRMQVLPTQLKIFNILWLGVSCANLDCYRWSGHNYIDFKMPSDSISMHLFLKIYLGGIPPDF